MNVSRCAIYKYTMSSLIKSDASSSKGGVKAVTATRAGSISDEIKQCNERKMRM